MVQRMMPTFRSRKYRCRRGAAGSRGRGEEREGVEGRSGGKGATDAGCNTCTPVRSGYKGAHPADNHTHCLLT